MRDKFYFFNSFLWTARELKDPVLQAKYLIAIAEYGIEGKESDDPIIRALMNQTKFTMDKSLELSEQKSDKMKWNKNASKDWSKLWNQSKTEKNRDKQTGTETNREKQEVEEEVEEEVENKNKESKEKFWAFVLLTQNEHTKLLEIFWEKRLNQEIEKLNNYIWSKGTKYKSHYFTIRKRNEDFILKQKNKEPPKNSCERQSAGDLDPIIS